MGMRSFIFLLGIILLMIGRAAAQTEPLALPADLYLLMGEGVVVTYPDQTALTPPDRFITDFGIDTLGERIAYRTPDGLFVALLASPEGAAQIEAGTAGVPAYRGQGDTIAWSPAGDAIAYTTLVGARVRFETGGAPTFAEALEGVFLSLDWSPGGTFLVAQAEGGIWWVYRREGAALTLTSIVTSSDGIAWLADDQLVFTPAEGGLRVMALNAANAQSTLLDETGEYHLPTLAADDSLRFFGRDKADLASAPGYGQLLRLARGASAVEPGGSAVVSVQGLRWMPGGVLLTAFQGGVLALLDPASGEIYTLPIANLAAFAWGPYQGVQAAAPTLTLTPSPSPSGGGAQSGAGIAGTPTLDLLPTPTLAPPETVAGLRLPAEYFFLARDGGGITQVYWLPSDGRAPARFTGSLEDVQEFAPAANGRAVAYAVPSEVWLQRIDVPPPTFLAEIGVLLPIGAALSPDGTQAAYTDETTENGGIWIVASDGSDPFRALANGGEGTARRVYRSPRWSPDGARLLIDVIRPDGQTFGVFDTAARQIVEAPVISMEDYSASTATWTPDGRILVWRDTYTPGTGAGTPTPAPAGFYRYEAALGATAAQWTPLPAGVFVLHVVQPSNAPDTLIALLADDGDPTRTLQVVRFAGGESELLLSLGAFGRAQLSPDGAWVAGTIPSAEAPTRTLGDDSDPLIFIQIATGQRYAIAPGALGIGEWSAVRALSS